MKKTKKKLKIGITGLMCIGLAISSLPLTYATEIPQNTDLNSKIVIEELTDLREEYTKHFLNSDGTITAVTYNDTIHYKDNDGKWKDINNTLVSKEIESYSQNKNNTDNYLTLEDNPLMNIQFNKNSNSNNLVNIQNNGHYIKLGIANSLKKNATIIDNSSTTNNKFSLLNLKSNVAYDNILDSADLEFEVNSTNLLTKLTFEEKPTTNKIKFNLSTDLVAKQDEHGLIFFYNEDANEESFILQVPYLYDKSENSRTNDNIDVSLSKTMEGYTLEYTLDENWLNDNETNYPVTYMATANVTNDRYRQNILDTYVHPGDHSGDHHNSDRLYVGNREGGSRAFINWANFPSIDGTIVSASLDFNYMPGTSSWGPIDIFQVNSSWSSSTINYSQSASFNYNPLYVRVTPTLRTYQNFNYDITSTVKGWYNGNIGRNGFMIKYTDESYNDYNSIISGDSALNSAYWPGFAINYIPSTSLRGYAASYPSSSIDSQMNSFVFYFDQIGYNTTKSSQPSLSSIRNGITSRVVALAGHGNRQLIDLGDNGVFYLKDAILNVKSSEENYYRDKSFVGLQNTNLSSTDLIIFAGCQTSEGPNNSNHPLARRAVDYGAKSSIGWTESFSIKDGATYMDRLAYALWKGKSVQGAIDYANGFSYSDSSVRSSYAWGNTSIVISNFASLSNLSKNISKINDSEIEPTEYEITNTYNSRNATISPKEFAINYIKENLNSDFDINDYDIYNSEDGRNISFTFTPYGIKTDNVYTAIIENNKVTKITSYIIDENLNAIKSILKDKELLNNETEIINEILSNYNNQNISVRNTGYQYSKGVLKYFVIYDINNDGIIHSDIEFFEV